MFVILSHQRAGSHLLRTLLNSHPDLHCYGEAWSGTEPDPYFDPLSFPIKENEGVMIKYDKVQKKSDTKKRELLKNAKVIHLKRKNLEKQMASYAAMRRLNMKGWVTKVPHVNKKEISLKHIHGSRGVKRILRLQKAIEEIEFNNLLEVYYEDLTEDKEISILSIEKAKPILEFLEVPIQSLTTDVAKTQLYEIGVGKGKKYD